MKRILATVGLVLLACCAVWAQVSESTYKLQPEDVVRIQVYNETQINIELPIGRDGNISAPFVGSVKAAGKTVDELAADLAKEYIKHLRLRDPKVSVSIVIFRQIKASVSGAVNRPGIYPLRPGDTLLTLLNYGGGADSNRGNLHRAVLTRASAPREHIPIDLFAMLIYADTSQNYTIEDGDELLVPEENTNRIQVLGMVAAPGIYPFKEPMTIVDAIAAARGGNLDRARFSRTIVMRQQPGNPGHYDRIKVDFARYINQGDSSQNIELKPGDTVWVPETNTPDLNHIASVLNTLFFFNSIFNQGLFGFRLH